MEGLTFVYLVRHAHTHWQPDEQRSLSARGREDARRLAGELARYPITRVYASSMRRASETVSPLAQRLGLPVETLPALRERKLAGAPVSDFLSAVRHTWEAPDFAFPGGESNRAAQRRGVAIVEQMMARHRGEHIVMGTHGNLLALILANYDAGVGYDFWAALTMPDVYVVRFSEGAVSRHRLCLTCDLGKVGDL